jgi:tetratricopeptide (TPR) repeat protein
VARALAVAREALEQMSTSHRLRSLGEIAFAHGELELAEDCYGELVRRTAASLTRSGVDAGMLGQVFVTRGAADKALRVVSAVEDDPDAPSRALAAAVQAQALSAQGDTERSEVAARRALSLAGAAEAPENVLLMVAQGAFAAGLRDEAKQVAGRALGLRRSAGGPGALARRVLGDAGIDAEAFAKEVVAARSAPNEDGGLAGAKARSEGDLEAHGSNGTEARGPDGQATRGGTAAPAAADLGQSAEDGRTSASEDVQLALKCLHVARFDDAVKHVARARTKLPTNPMVLMAAVQVQMLRMRAQGFDEETARDVRRCLLEIDRQIPGDGRVLEGLER